MNKQSKIQIIGGGTFGLSTAYYLAKDGYADITVIDREKLPSKFSAGYDLNKIIRPEYEDQFYTGLALEALKLWESPEFSPFFHKVGYVNCNSSKAPQKSMQTVTKFYENLIMNENFPKNSITLLQTEQDFKLVLPLDINFKGWTGYFNKHAGYAHAFKALEFLAKECSKLGVKFIIDRIDSIIYDKSTCIGVHSESNTIYHADFTILSLGAHISSIMPELNVTPKAWSVGHLHLSEDEAKPLKNMPVFNCRDIGFCFEPDEDNNILKMCNSSAGWVNYKDDTKLSIPTEDNSGVCKIDKEALDNQAKIFFPNISKPVVDRKICWCCDRSNSDYVIDFHPNYSNLLLATADSGHAFKMLPIFGKWVLGRLNGTLTKEQRERWKWFDEEPVDETDEISWRLGQVLNLLHEERN